MCVMGLCGGGCASCDVFVCGRGGGVLNVLAVTGIAFSKNRTSFKPVNITLCFPTNHSVSQYVN